MFVDSRGVSSRVLRFVSHVRCDHLRAHVKVNIGHDG